MTDERGDGDRGGRAQRRWSAPLTFLLLLAVPAAVYAVVLLDRPASAGPTPSDPPPPAPTTSSTGDRVPGGAVPSPPAPVR